jgi:hypothetical protein
MSSRQNIDLLKLNRDMIVPAISIADCPNPMINIVENDHNIRQYLSSDAQRIDLANA